MTDRPDARSFVIMCLVQPGYSHDAAEALVQRVLDEHARELAEEIRALPLSGTEAGIRDALADLIDPDVTTEERENG